FHRIRRRLPLGVEILHEGGVAAIEERGLGEHLVDQSSVVRHLVSLPARVAKLLVREPGANRSNASIVPLRRLSAPRAGSRPRPPARWRRGYPPPPSPRSCCPPRPCHRR